MKPPRLIGIVSGSGGPQALEVILEELPPQFDVPIIIIPSVADFCLEAFVEWLADRSQIPVSIIENGQIPESHMIYVAGTDRDVIIEGGLLRRLEREGQIHNPKDALFRSMASELGPSAVAVILTGMGPDGARGMKAIRDVGGFTIAQDQSTSMVYSTPRFAVEWDAACESLPLPEIAPRLIDLVWGYNFLGEPEV